MNTKKIDNILNLPSDQRYIYFVKKVADFEEIWGLYAPTGWALVGDGNKKYFPVWPEKEFAQLCAKEGWKDYSPKSMTLDEFLNKWISKIQNDGLEFSVFLSPDNKSIITKPEKLQKDISDECEQYED